jgi:hypothetical protein
MIAALITVASSIPATSAIAAGTRAPKHVGQHLQAGSGRVAPSFRTTIAQAAARHLQQSTTRKPFLARNAKGLAAAKAHPRASGAHVISSALKSAPSSVRGGSPRITTTTGGHVFNGVSQDFEIGRIGGFFVPPDTMAAAGPFEVVETVNDQVAVFNKSSGALTVTFDLNALGFPHAAGYSATDPRILFDQESGRWFLSVLEFNPITNASQVWFGVSQTASFSSVMMFYEPDNDPAQICDQPKMGVNTTMVSISCANFSTTAFTGQTTWVVNKAQVEAFQVAQFNIMTTGPNSFFSITPAQSLTPTTTAWMAENDSGNLGIACPAASLALISVTGVPPSAGFAFTCQAITATTAPVPAVQPGSTVDGSGICTAGCIETDDARIASATYQGGRLWTGMTETCTPTGDTVLRDCMRLFQVATSGPTIANSTDIAATGSYFSYPAVSMDLNGNLFVSYTASSATINPAAAVVTLLAGTTTVDTNQVIQPGGSAYVPPAGANRWGDYSAVAPDPDPNAAGNVWAAAEDTAGDNSWNTVLGQLSINPAVTGMSPTSGSASGGQPFTITGSFFNPGARVSFGGHLATDVVVAAGGASLTGLTPSSIGSTAVNVTVINPDGKTAAVSGLYTFGGGAVNGTDFYFAEGNTFGGFNETFDLLMPNWGDGTAPLAATITYQTESGTLSATHPMTAGQVTKVNVGADVGAGHTVSAHVHLPAPGVAERTLNFTFGAWHGSTDQVGASSPAAEWDFAEGSTFPFFSEFLTLQNPDPATPSAVTINYFTDAGQTVTKTLQLPPVSRTTISVATGNTSNGACTISGGVAQNCGVGPGIGGVSTQVLVNSGPNIVAERPFYVNNFSFGPGPIRDGHDAFGANAPNSTWFFAEGTTLGGFNAYLTLQNPGASGASTTITYNTDSGAAVNKTLTLPAHSRTTLPIFQGNLTSSSCTVSGGVAQNCGVGPNIGGVSSKVVVTSGPNIVVERPMYTFFNFGTGVVAGAHVVVGANSLRSTFGFSASNTTAGENDFLTLQNPGGTAASVNLTYYDNAQGFPVNEVVTVAANSRFTVPVSLPAYDGGGIGPGFSGLGIVVSSNQPILVEKPTYDSNAATYGATDTLGFTPSPAF